MQMTIPLKRWQVRQDSKNDFCGFRCVIRPIQKMFKLKSFFTLILVYSLFDRYVGIRYYRLLPLPAANSEIKMTKFIFNLNFFANEILKSTFCSQTVLFEYSRGQDGRSRKELTRERTESKGGNKWHQTREQQGDDRQNRARGGPGGE
jgi:hypothetical protein